MKQILIKLLMCSSLFNVIIPSHAQDGPSHDKLMKMSMEQAHHDTVKIAILLYQDVVIQDFAGPMEVFSKAKNLTNNSYEIFTIGLNSKDINTENQLLHLKADYTLEDAPAADYLIIPGASMPVINALMTDLKLKSFINAWGNTNADAKTVAICTGSYLLANTGKLNHKRATTHFFVADDYASLFPEVEVVKDVRFVDEGSLITSSGVTSGIDAALHIVSLHSGDKIKNMISRALQYTFHQKEPWPVAPNGMKYQRP